MISNHKGFTLVELLVVIAIFATMIAIAIPSMRDWIFMADYRNASQQVLQALKQGRNRAISRNREQRVEFDLDGSDNTYVYKISEGNRASNSSTWTDTSVWQDSEIPASVALRGNNGGACNGVVDITFGFNPNGSSSTNYICIMEAQNLSTRHFRVGIANPNTGRVTITQ